MNVSTYPRRPIPANKLMVILSVKSGLVKTMMMEVFSEIPREKLEDLARMLTIMSENLEKETA